MIGGLWTLLGAARYAARHLSGSGHQTGRITMGNQAIDANGEAGSNTTAAKNPPRRDIR
jgi:hypothetical protein